jgi:hypothetical protein
MRPSGDHRRSHSSVARALLTTLFLCVACSGGGVHGRYTSKDGAVFNFKSNGKVEVNVPVFGIKGPTQEMDYAFEDGKIMLGPSNMPRTVMPLDEKGCFVFGSEQGFVGGKMCKEGSEDATAGT